MERIKIDNKLLVQCLKHMPDRWLHVGFLSFMWNTRY